MKISLAQINVESGKCEQNFQKIKTLIQQAKDEQVDIIVFPEMCISGYLLHDKFLDDAFCNYIASYNEKIKALSAGIGIVFGNLHYQAIQDVKYGRDGRKARFNAVFFACDKKWVKKENEQLDGIHIKHLNPDYRFFDDSRYFLSGIEVSNHLYQKMDALISPFIFERNGKIYRIGLEVCEDLWSFDYSVDVTSVYAQQGIDFLINVSTSPYTRNKEHSRHRQIKKHVEHLGDKMPVVFYVNAVGMQNTGKNIVLFDGDSSVYNTQGDLVFSLNDRFKEEYRVYDFKNNAIAERCENKILAALTCAIYEFDRQIFPFKPKWVIGLSGGIDSCVNAALLVKALGNERVIGYNMATKYNSQMTKNNARILADKLNIEIREGSIENINDATLTTMQNYGYENTYDSLVYENIQARIRGHLLSSFASIENGVIINNANKIEVALGYCTLYGDSIGAISPIGDLSKVQVFELAKQLNEYFGDEIISKSLIPEVIDDEIYWQMPPSAELKDEQLDPMKWYYHDYIIQMLLDYPTGNIEKLLESYLDGTIYEGPLGPWIKYYGLDNGISFIEDLEWLLNKMYGSVFKRIQMPPIVVLSRGAFGSDYRESQLGFLKTSTYEALKLKILSL
ncbi:NAD+ synthase (glutamine-hydrolyzing) [Breznakia sp. PF5-3]|uniref:NAD(+) synthase n=1 Tax=unclassified Breznakia TaxID=2623764 RepID=UPI0024051F82|nr:MULTISPECIES: NAD(+) synthase [unclassified Breznakia]MDF9823894.1 NAD+ synthase (glutamine-hydrolyzing) [Breznakia sp. PM6-1]MDF9834693.1 NAD+ synthase (glutamine-hydrolyzing) [Breznakia sp. PF5-3]MDF9836872.1 NAD+ synthase (glutamine-hydrolyzing) [Breznakia sp. PFB2-8]MDF9858889.1 NAD+ synthase (glutamine-hydrolyzing) [Breznakia sp. PH5-24]